MKSFYVTIYYNTNNGGDNKKILIDSNVCICMLVCIYIQTATTTTDMWVKKLLKKSYNNTEYISETYHCVCNFLYNGAGGTDTTRPSTRMKEKKKTILNAWQRK